MRSLSSKSTSASFRGLRWGGPALAYAKILRRRVVPAAATAVDVRVPAQRRLQWPRTHRRRKAAMSGLLFVALVTAAQAGAFGRTMNFGAALRLMLPGNVWLARKLVEMQTGLGLFNSCLLAREATRLEVLHVFWCYLSSKLVLWTYPWRPGTWSCQRGVWRGPGRPRALWTAAQVLEPRNDGPATTRRPPPRRRRDHVQGNT